MIDLAANVLRKYTSSVFCFGSICLLISSLLNAAWAQDAVRVRSHEFHPDDITVGDAVTLKLFIEADEDLHIYLDAIDVSRLPYVEVDKAEVKRLKPDKRLPAKALYEVAYPLRVFAPGLHTLPPVTIKYTSDAGDASIQTNAFSFEVRSVKPPNATEIKEIAPPFALTSNALPYILGAALLLSAAGALIYWYIRRRARPVEVRTEAAPTLTPDKIAHERLRQIEARNLVAEGEMKLYHTEISHAIRQYIELRYGIPALELTTEELLDRLAHEMLEAGTLRGIRDFFDQCNLVKFAKYQPNKPEAHAQMDEARRIVDTTKQLRLSGPSEEASAPSHARGADTFNSLDLALG